MSSWKGKTKGGLLGYKIFIFLLKKGGINASYTLLRIVALYYVVFAGNASKSIYTYFRDIHQFGFYKSIKAIYKNYVLLGQTIIDKVALIAGFENKFTYTFEGEAHLRAIKPNGKGGILISAHLGNWDIAGFLLKRLDWKINIVMFEAEHEKIKHYMDEVMGQRNVNIIPIKEDLSHIFLINNALRNNEIICFHGDRFVEGSSVEKKEFMNKEAYFPTGPFNIVSKLKVPYSFVYAVKESKYHYHLFATPLQMEAKNAGKILDDYICSLEDKVKQYPLQWFNYYDFWSSSAKGANLKTK